MTTKFQLLSCDIALGGDILNVVARHALIPVTYPEMLVLKYLHGQESITNIFDVGYIEREDDDERKRLMETYGADLIREKLFPGAGQRLPNGDNRYLPRVEGTQVNPVPAPAPAPVAPAAPPPVEYAVDPQPNTYVPTDPPPAPPSDTPVVDAAAAAVISRKPIPVADGATS